MKALKNWRNVGYQYQIHSMNMVLMFAMRFIQVKIYTMVQHLNVFLDEVNYHPR